MQVSPRYVLGIVATAVIATGFAIAFRWTLAQAWHLAAEAPNVVAAMEYAPWWLRLVLPAIGGLLAGLLVVYAARTTTGTSGVGGLSWR